MSPQEIVDLAIRLLRDAHHRSDDAKLIARMVDAGLNSDLANLLVVLVPLAFSRIHFESVPMIKEYAENYILLDHETGKETSHILAADPYFCAAAIAAQGLDDEALMLEIAKRSSEYHAINNVLSNLPEGAIPTRIGTSPPYVMQGTPRPRPRWNFWRR